MTKVIIKKYFKISLSIILVALFVLFFYKEFRENWESVRTLQLEINWIYLVAGVLMMIANYLCTTLSWHIGVNYFDNHEKLIFTQSFALVNISQLGKYIPGKLWSYMVQIYWLESKGVPKATTLYLNILTTLLPIIVSLLTGCILLIMLPGWQHLKNEIVISICILIIINLFIFNKSFLRFILEKYSRVSGRKIFFQQLSTYRIIFMELLYAIGALFWALAGCFISMGMGFGLENLKIIFISSAMLLGDVIGFLILIAPGGLGVREGTMYFILKGAGVIQFALIFPMIIRLMGIITDFIMGAISVVVMSKSKYFVKGKEQL
jgi:glycosyltransferase 2 family protein